MIDTLIHDPLTRFLAQVAAIVLLARVLGLVVRRIGQPMVIAEITAGILLGPSLLGWVAPELSAAVFAPDSLHVLQLVSQLGLILFMFLIGLELDPSLLRGRRHASVIISHTSIVVPFGLGALLALHLYPRLSTEDVSFTAFTLFLGAAMSITAFPVLARILSERRLLQTKLGAITIACAAVDDVTAWCILAFVVATARSTGIAAAAITTLGAIGYILAMFYVVRPLLSRIADRIGPREGLSQNVVAVTMLLLFASSWATELIGIHALFGAFLFGAILPREGGLARSLAEKLEDFVLVILLPLFFAYSGVRTQIGLLDSAAAWWTCGLIVIVACLGKFGGSALAARFTGLSWRESGALGVLMNTRGLMELIVLNIGLDLGVISPTLFAMMVVMALVTTFMTTPILQLIFPDHRIAEEYLEPDGLRTSAAPTIERRFTTLICVAHPKSGPGLLTVARAIGGNESSGRAYALQLVPAPERASDYLPEPTRRDGALAPVLAHARKLAFDVRPLSFVSAQPAEDICNVAQAKDVDLILMGWHKPILGRSILGGTVYHVMKEAPRDVGVFVDRGLRDVRRVLVPYQGRPDDEAALAIAGRIVRSCGAELTVLHVGKPGASRVEGGHGVDEIVWAAIGDPNAHRITVKTIEHASPAQAAVDESRRGHDLVVVGMGREWGLEHRFFGISPERILEAASTSLLVVRRGHEARERATAISRATSLAEAT